MAILKIVSNKNNYNRNKKLFTILTIAWMGLMVAKSLATPSLLPRATPSQFTTARMVPTVRMARMSRTVPMAKMATTPPDCRYGAFDNIDPNRVIYVPKDSVEDYKSAAEYWNYYYDSIVGHEDL